MTGTKVFHRVSAENLTFLKPHKLGRHYHKVPGLIKELCRKYPKIISDYFLRNYRSNIDLSNVAAHEHFSSPTEHIYNSKFGKLGVRIDRELLTEALECYYGSKSQSGPDNTPVSSSEERMRNRIANDVAQIYARVLFGGDLLLPLDPIPPVYTDYEDITWEYLVEFEYTSLIRRAKSSILLYLDTQLIDELLKRLSTPTLGSPRSKPLKQIRQLPVKLNCVLTRLQLPLQHVLALRLGDILTVRLFERCEVYINQQKLFHGVISEDDGSLILTSLDSVKNQ